MGYSDDYLEHHGILGQKWGVRRFENAQGHLTAAGLKRYEGGRKVTAKEQNAGASVKVKSATVTSTGKKESSKEETTEKKGLTDKQKKMIVAGAAIVGTAVAAYGGYKLYQMNKEAKEGLSNEYHNMAVKSFMDANHYAGKAQEYHITANFGKERYGTTNAGVEAAKIGEAYFDKQSQLTRDLANQLKDKAKSKNFSVKEKVDYLKSKDDKLRSQKQLEKVQQQYNEQREKWKQGSQSTPPPIPTTHSKAGMAATNKLASEASSLAKSVTAEGPKSFSKPAQNSGITKQAMTNQKLAATVTSFNTGKKAVSNTTKIHGQTKFSQASKANDDLVSDLLKKNAAALAGF